MEQALQYQCRKVCVSCKERATDLPIETKCSFSAWGASSWAFTSLSKAILFLENKFNCFIIILNCAVVSPLVAVKIGFNKIVFRLTNIGFNSVLQMSILNHTSVETRKIANFIKQLVSLTNITKQRSRHPFMDTIWSGINNFFLERLRIVILFSYQNWHLNTSRLAENSCYSPSDRGHCNQSI